jgi:multisubunit Na+/H+ antiporter MnhB subunit
MSDVRTLAVALILAGLIGAVSMVMYLFAYKYVTQQLIPVSHRRRVLAWRRCAPTVLGVSVGTTAIGLLLLLIAAVALAV